MREAGRVAKTAGKFRGTTADSGHDLPMGRWPKPDDGAISEAPGETWSAVDAALQHGSRGLSGGSSLARLLENQRQVRNRKNLPPLTEQQVVSWAMAHRRLTGNLPNENSGPIDRARGEVWNNVNQALRQGSRGLPGGDSLAKLLARRLGVRNGTNIPPLTTEEILTWADAHHERTGAWPTANSGKVVGAAGETWLALDDALRLGLRRLPGGLSLARLLERRRGVRNKSSLPPLTEAQIVVWADDHERRTGCRPTSTSGAILAAGSETWCGVDQALRKGRRGLPGGDSLSRLLSRSGSELAVRGVTVAFG